MRALPPDPGGFLRRSGPITRTTIALVLVSLVFILFPGLDIAATRLFYVAGEGFPASRMTFLRDLRDLNDDLLMLAAVVIVASFLSKLRFPRRPSPVPPHVVAFVLGTLALGTGLIVNGLFKSFSGRPRPIATDLFGGKMEFIPAWNFDGLCQRNCSFISGEGSSAMWLVVFVLLLPRPARGIAFALLLPLVAALSLNRVAFGGHYLSDVLIAWCVTLIVILALYRVLIVDPRARRWSRRADAALGLAIARGRARLAAWWRGEAADERA
ncbi:phosphatase PAP2 family protein [Prosthecomicrobium pneumaticum]|uniref:Membrane-associated PAP2 superfamily phosphatase n=1 Tax=Prosthecomicrobium pneumaticum TaxID=81895 RepID=A0A7W9FLY7_9HYPH|nr:phosphatase PAP2 family protein [Prosthecomicrobium pneumaticum]MBB5753091.1 membrane-associated PAP2 superfamily phosphatase [Prosthecomicrobium pneumaticum]